MPLSEEDLQGFIASIPELTAHRDRATRTRVIRSTKQDIAERVANAFGSAGLVVMPSSDCNIGV
jgi:hypothetical protein